MKNYLQISFLLSVFLLSNCSFNQNKKSENEERPNIILIISDDQSWTDYSFMEHEYIQTPRIDQLAASGLTFTHGYTTAPLCSPALASIATGLYPHQHGILGNDPVFSSTERKNSRLQDRRVHYQPFISKFEELETIADVLGEQGYTSLQTGKWWLGNYKSGGFDEGMTHGDPARGGRHGDEGLKIGREGMDVIFRFIDSADEQNKPFYVWYAPFLPHAPHNPPDSLREKYLPVAPTEAVANYWAMCEWFDITCGQLMDYVEQKGLTQNTMFIYVTDNGWIQDPDKPNAYAPRSKREPYEMGIRTPIIFSWDGKIEPEFNTKNPVSSIDIATTIYEICDIESPAGLQGINVLDTTALKNREVIFAETYAHDFTTIDSSLYYRIAIDFPWKLILPDKTNKPEAETELFNIENDPFEKENLALKYPELLKDLEAKIEKWWSLDKKSINSK
jgi:arylsulfatase A-like enzyme